jgi:tetratricopeptide (TPR) repeat protein
MRRKRTSTPLIIVAIVIVVALVAGWFVLKSLPTRQLARFPQFVQELVIPEPDSAVLPASDVVVDTAALLKVNPTIAPPPTPTESVVIVADSAEPDPTPTATPIPTPTPEPLPTYVRMEDFDHRTQDWNNCGPATLAMALTHFDLNFTQYETAEKLKPNEEDRNVTPQELAAFVNNNTDTAALARVNGDLDLLRELLANGFPAIIEIGLDPPGEVAYLEWYGHYLLATGYDDSAEELWVFDSLWWDTEELSKLNSEFGRPYTYAELEEYWPQFNSTYVVMYDPARSDELATILGDDMDDTLMWQGSLENARARLETHPDDAFAWFNLGSSHVNLEQYVDAAAAFDKARSVGLPWRMLWYQFGPYEAYLQTDRFVDVILLANTTLEGRPYFEESFYYKALAQSALGDIDGARESLNLAVAFNPTFATATDALANLDS